MNVRTTIVLLVVLVLLAGYVLWPGSNQGAADIEDTLDVSDTSSELAEIRMPVLTVNSADIQTIEVADAAGETVTLVRQGDTWNLTAPNAAPADAFQVSRVITDLVELTASRVFTPTEGTLADYGLAEPEYQVTLSGADGVLARLRLGTTNPNGSSTYLQREGAPTIYLVSNFVVDGVRNWVDTPPVQPTPFPTSIPFSPATPSPAATPTAGEETAPPPPTEGGEATPPADEGGETAPPPPAETPTEQP